MNKKKTLEERVKRLEFQLGRMIGLMNVIDNVVQTYISGTKDEKGEYK